MSAKGSYSGSPWESRKIIFVKSDGDCRGYVSFDLKKQTDDLTQNDSGHIIATKPPFLVTPNGSLGSGNPPQFRKYFDLPRIVPLILIYEENVHRDRYLKGNAGAAGLSFKKLQLPLENRIATIFPDHACGC